MDFLQKSFNKLRRNDIDSFYEDYVRDVPRLPLKMSSKEYAMRVKQDVELVEMQAFLQDQ